MIRLKQIEAYAAKHDVPLHINIAYPEKGLVVAISISKLVFHYFRGLPDSMKYEYTYSQRNEKRRRLKAKHIQNLITRLKDDKETTD